MKTWLIFLILASFQVVVADPLQVPENCLKNKIVPCLAKAQDHQDFKFDDQALHMIVDGNSIVKWTSFENGPQLQLLKGQFKIEGVGFQDVKHNTSTNEFKINNIPVPPEVKSALVRKDEDIIEILDLKTFTISTFKQAENNIGIALVKNRFLDKEEFVRYAATFFKTKKILVSFLASVEESWKSEFERQSASQTNVLKRSIASVQEEKNKLEVDRLTHQIKLKKVREMFFFRTFYR